jgi:uncharacterized protein (TIGR02246 family)
MTDEEKIRRLVADWLDASNRGALDEVLTWMDDDVVFLTPGNPPMQGKEAFAEGFRSTTGNARIESSGEVKQVEVAGDLAFCWTQLSVKVIPQSGDTVERAGPTLTILRREPGGGWVVYRDANMLAPV